MFQRMRTFELALASGITNSRLRHVFTMVFRALAFFFVCSIVLVAGGLLPDRFAWTASGIMALNAVAVFVSELRRRKVGITIVTFLLLASGGFLVEFVGVKTGFPFGKYAYTDALGFRLLGVPVAIALAWYVTIICTVHIARWIHGNAPLMRLAFSAALMTLALDIALEPMASFIHGYWVWESGSVPPQNFLSWFILGYAGALLMLLREPQSISPTPDGRALSAAFVFATQSVLFALTNAVNGYLVATLAALVFGSIPFFSRIKHRWFFKEEGLIER